MQSINVTNRDEEILLSIMTAILATKSGVRNDVEANIYLEQAVMLRKAVASFVTFKKKPIKERKRK